MESSYIKLFFYIIFVMTLSNSKSIVKNLPGFPGDLPFTLETGYVGVGAENEVQFFYYFVESQRDPAHDPLLLYLTGGPGTSGLFPFLYHVGPLTIRFDSSGWNNFTLESNPNTWTQAANVIFLDLPAGVGFSYATTWEGWRSSDSVLSMHTYEFIQKWFVEHPRFLNNPLYISGISYMGLLIPVITLEVYKGIERGSEPQLNIKGYLIVNAFTDRFIDENSKLEFANRVALISDDIYESTKETCDDNYAYPNLNNALCSYNIQQVDECIRNINLANILGTVPDDTADIKIILDAWANDKEVQKALHIREGTIGVWEKTNETIHFIFGKNDTICYSYDVSSTIVYHEQLVSRNCHVLIISGDHDMIIPYLGTEKWIKSLGVPIARPWNPWFVDNQVAGYQMAYATKGYSLTYATVKGAGHSLQLNKPKEASVLVEEWLTSHTYISDF
ncbi:putative peptidase S10, serine carboxypeptidase, alpha/Beta hydrolase [Helianthus annuus]|uniref:Peptidase S10, serine carboxypeptidase, alpha/Beta hydrolase n=1 Tax=Helianthus annuus TaxID=4232 RepID=A0A251S824_HELAN|nr:serine carboxypeptidase-like 13 [Helianthus annuus]KAF5764080.1 putative peptidase S10, serine carboxypeptidase, alpha/Beta hydrolase [Helianthus annuus]KAJ0450808.1 putative peptidase S10, serine carboxypeptidase, alpha/Beta hydrolase [Helianthus annuus]KAJ0472668.1 putative peptidase S10, serine carboxypeptidase, alpha/Beta hydrolase [Helianthus annuus]KAJ0630020.1 putative peptidase S10, serine carboxypeptidase, alpha/Beta hydrolase [Helianthus annuus]KAJ0648270.1 putative peptidase S10,